MLIMWIINVMTLQNTLSLTASGTELSHKFGSQSKFGSLLLPEKLEEVVSYSCMNASDS